MDIKCWGVLISSHWNGCGCCRSYFFYYYYYHLKAFIQSLNPSVNMVHAVIWVLWEDITGQDRIAALEENTALNSEKHKHCSSSFFTFGEIKTFQFHFLVTRSWKTKRMVVKPQEIHFRKWISSINYGKGKWKII